MFKLSNKKELLRVMSYLKPRIVPYWIGLIGSSLIGSGFNIVMAFVFKNMIDAAVEGNTDLMIQAAIMVCSAVLVLSIISPIFRYMNNKAIQETMNDIRFIVFRHVEHLPISYYDRNHTGEIISCMNYDIGWRIERMYSQDIPRILYILLTGIGSIVAMFALEWRFAMILLGFGIFTGYINTKFSRPFIELSRKKMFFYRQLTERLIDFLAGFNTMKMFRIQNIIEGHYKQYNQETTDVAIQRGKIHAKMTSVNSFLSYLGFVSTIAIGAFMVFLKQITFGTVIAVTRLLNGVTSIFMDLGGVVVEIRQTLASLVHAFEIIDHPIEPVSYKQSGDTNISPIEYESKMILMKDISFRYEEDSPILEELSLAVDKGQLAAVVGPSGGGKSTIVKLLLGFYPWQEGNIFIGGKPISEYTLDEIRDLVSYVSQDSFLFDASIEENIRCGRLDATREEIIKAAEAANAHDFITAQSNGYDTLVGERGVRLSGGQKQRIAIARALLKDAPILLLDEATSSLDSENEQIVQDALNVLMKGRTTIAIAHRLSTIENADIIYVVDGGRVVEEGKHDMLLSLGGMYRDLYELQFKQQDEVAAAK